MIHPDTALSEVDQTVGLGVVATRLIPRGSITWVLDALDQRISPEQFASLPAAVLPMAYRYTWFEPTGERILCWDHGRYVNHACEPTCVGTHLGFEIAVRDIQPGEQLTNDYSTLGLLPEECFECRCGLPSCRGAVTTFLPEHRRRWIDRALRTAMQALPEVDQPLLGLLSHETVQAARSTLGLGRERPHMHPRP